MARAAAIFASGAVAATLCIAVASDWGSSDSGDRAADVSVARGTAPRVGTELVTAALFTGGTGYQWGGGDHPGLEIGASVASGDSVDLVEGIAEFYCRNGVQARLEGPATFSIDRESHPRLVAGAASFVIPTHRQMPRIDLPNCHLLASHGEYGCRVFAQQSEVHCFEGSTSVYLESGEVVELRTGEAITIAHSGDGADSVVRRKAQRLAFATMMPQSSRLPLTDAYADAVRSSGPFAYWRFSDPLTPIGSRLPSEIDGKISLRLDGDLRITGPGGNPYVDFGAAGESGYLISDEPITALASAAYTLEYWLRPSHYQYATIAALVQDPGNIPEKHGILLELGNYGGDIGQTYSFLHRTPPSGIAGEGDSVRSWKPYRVREWQHIAAVYDAGKMTIYMDGEVVAERRFEASKLPADLYLLLGRVYAEAPSRVFFGQLDELALYERALTGEEVRSHHAVGRDANEGAPSPNDGAQFVTPSRKQAI